MCLMSLMTDNATFEWTFNSLDRISSASPSVICPLSVVYLPRFAFFENSNCEKPSLFEASAQKNEDYETILSTLASDIRKRQLKLSEIRLRERRSTLLATLYTLGAWVAYVSVWYFDSLPAMGTSKFVVAKGVKVLPVLFGPVVYVYPSFPFSFT
jgi:hypothetical protein